MNNVVILAGGRGSRMGEQTDRIPKPMVSIGGKPIIEHIMYNYTRFLGRCKFVILAGYRHDILQQYFKNEMDVVVLDTGEETQTGGRIGKIADGAGWLTEPFHVCYGDGLTDFDLSQLRFRSDEIVNMLTVHPIGRFGDVRFNRKGRVTNFSEKPIDDRWINGGFFVMRPEVLDNIVGTTNR